MCISEFTGYSINIKKLSFCKEIKLKYLIIIYLNLFHSLNFLMLKKIPIYHSSCNASAGSVTAA